MQFPLIKKYATMGNPVISFGQVIPNHSALHNQVSWMKIIDHTVKDERCEWTLEELTKAVAQGSGHGGPRRGENREFVLYCCDMKWLKIKPVLA